jgi:hypothetical protein
MTGANKNFMATGYYYIGWLIAIYPRCPASSNFED